MHTRRADAAAIVGLAAVYVLAARLGLSIDPVSGIAALVWPPTGIALAALLLFGYRVWPGVLIGGVVASLLSGGRLPVALGMAAGNTVEALLAVYLLRRAPRFSITLETASSVVGFIIFAALFSTAISATIGIATLYVAGVISAPQLAVTWRAWWIGNVVGDLLVAPLILVWARPPRAKFGRNPMEGVALALATVAVSLAIFFTDISRAATLASPFHEAGLILAVMIWAALRFGQRGAATAAFLLSAAAIAATIMGRGPFMRADLQTSLMSLQTFMAILAAIFLLLGGTIAERRSALESARRAQEEAMRANMAKSEFLRVMSHELRTPLNAIAGYGELLRSGVYGTLNEKQTDALERVDRNEHELLELIDAVLSFVNIEKGEVHMKGEDVPVADLFDALEPRIKPEIAGKHVALKRELSPPPLAVHADRKAVQQILTNLVSNASKFTNEGGVITLGAERVDGRVRIWVRDTGVGIPEDAIQRVFEPFFQVEQGTARRFSGVGLGLAIARDLARKMDGEVTIASRVGEGTTASVVLPSA